MVAPANWKVAQEAFFETFHSLGATHPQLDDVGREIVYEGRVGGGATHTNVAYDTFPAAMDVSIPRGTPLQQRQ